MTRYVISPEAYPDGERAGRETFAAGDAVVVQNGIYWFSQGIAIQGKPAQPGGTLADLSVEVNGEILSITAAIDLGSLVSKTRDGEVVVGPLGYVASLHSAVFLRGGAGNTIENHGVIAGTQHAIRAGGEISITNHGAIGTYGDYYGEAPRYHAMLLRGGAATTRSRSRVAQRGS